MSEIEKIRKRIEELSGIHDSRRKMLEEVETDLRALNIAIRKLEEEEKQLKGEV